MLKTIPLNCSQYKQVTFIIISKGQCYEKPANGKSSSWCREFARLLKRQDYDSFRFMQDEETNKYYLVASNYKVPPGFKKSQYQLVEKLKQNKTVAPWMLAAGVGATVAAIGLGHHLLSKPSHHSQTQNTLTFQQFEKAIENKDLFLQDNPLSDTIKAMLDEQTPAITIYYMSHTDGDGNVQYGIRRKKKDTGRLIPDSLSNEEDVLNEVHKLLFPSSSADKSKEEKIQDIIAEAKNRVKTMDNRHVKAIFTQETDYLKEIPSNFMTADQVKAFNEQIKNQQWQLPDNDAVEQKNILALSVNVIINYFIDNDDCDYSNKWTNHVRNNYPSRCALSKIHEGWNKMDNPQAKKNKIMQRFNIVNGLLNTVVQIITQLAKSKDHDDVLFKCLNNLFNRLNS